MWRTQQRRLHFKLNLSQLCGKTADHYTHGLCFYGLCWTILSFVWLSNCLTKKPDVLIPPQGSYHCGSCKSGFTGDQVKGCKPEISCGNSLTNPCDINAQCIVERDGSVFCQVGFHTTNTVSYTLYTHIVYNSTHMVSELLRTFIYLVSVELAGLVTDTCAGRIPTLMDTQMRSSNARIWTVER